MPTVRKSAIVPRRCETLFALVDDVERYPEFLPWCPRTRVLERDDRVTVARIDIDYRGLKSHFVTRNAKHPPGRMTLELVEGPFEKLAGEWTFAPLGDRGCRAELTLEYEFAGSLLDVVLQGVFGHIAATLVDGFVQRAASAPEAQ
jgi:ribosome-associated toxin RatA of RatAB toxin-antitoxin module